MFKAIVCQKHGRTKEGRPTYTLSFIPGPFPPPRFHAAGTLLTYQDRRHSLAIIEPVTINTALDPKDGERLRKLYIRASEHFSQFIRYTRAANKLTAYTPANSLAIPPVQRRKTRARL